MPRNRSKDGLEMVVSRICFLFKVCQYKLKAPTHVASNDIRNTDIILTEPHRVVVSMMHDDLGVSCFPRTASEVFLMFTTQPYSCLYSYNAIDFIS